MLEKLCAHCGSPFQPRPQVPSQTFCADPACQKARRQRWHLEKLQADPDYRENKARSQKAWQERNPDYWRRYRDENPDYAERNRAMQRSPSAPPLTLKGLYRIRSVPASGLAKTDAWIVEIMPVCADCPCKDDACKDST